MKLTATKMGVGMAALAVAALIMSATTAAAGQVHNPTKQNGEITTGGALGGVQDRGDSGYGTSVETYYEPILSPTRQGRGSASEAQDTKSVNIVFYNRGGKGPYPVNH
jgi:hypothetical protein